MEEELLRFEINEITRKIQSKLTNSVTNKRKTNAWDDIIRDVNIKFVKFIEASVDSLPVFRAETATR